MSPYEEGQKAFLENVLIQSNPYTYRPLDKDGKKNTDWEEGFLSMETQYDEWRRYKLNELLYNIATFKLIIRDKGYLVNFVVRKNKSCNSYYIDFPSHNKSDFVFLRSELKEAMEWAEKVFPSGDKFEIEGFEFNE